MFTRVVSYALLGMEAQKIEVEVEIQSRDKAAFIIVGLPDAAVKESKERVAAALRSVGCDVSFYAITVNLAPADLKKEGAVFDFPIAAAILAALGKIPLKDIENVFFAGELGLDGCLKPVPALLAGAVLAKKEKLNKLCIPAVQIKTLSCLKEMPILGFYYLKEIFSGGNSCKELEENKEEIPIDIPDFKDIQGQEELKKAAFIAVAGHHNLFVSGPPGCGKTMVAKAMQGILPPISYEEYLEILATYSLAGMVPVKERPFRSPHHTVSYSGLIGGGQKARPGEISLAHHGILFLDELTEFPRVILEVLRQPLEEGLITISRARAIESYPCRFICVAAMNPCPCGLLGHPLKACKDSPKAIEKYISKISEPLMDRFDLHVEALHIPYQTNFLQKEHETTSSLKNKVVKARDRMNLRQGKPNGLLSAKDLEKVFQISKEGERLFMRLVEQHGFSMRAAHRIKKVALTLADIKENDVISEEEILMASFFKSIPKSFQKSD